MLDIGRMPSYQHYLWTISYHLNPDVSSENLPLDFAGLKLSILLKILGFHYRDDLRSL